jgi:AcrR family transcriptional regulator
MARPSQPLISRQRVIDAAIKLLDEHGAEGLTIRRLAAELDVNGASLYHHFRDKDSILEAVVEHLLSRVKLPDEALPPDEWFFALACAHRDVFRQHPKAAYLIGQFSAEVRVQGTEVAGRQLIRAGVTRNHAAIFSALLQYEVGSIILPSATFRDVTDDELFRLAFSALYRGLIETLSDEPSKGPRPGSNGSAQASKRPRKAAPTPTAP